MYKVNLTNGQVYSNIIKLNVWLEDNDYILFEYSEETFIMIRKEYIVSIEKIK